MTSITLRGRVLVTLIALSTILSTSLANTNGGVNVNLKSKALSDILSPATNLPNESSSSPPPHNSPEQPTKSEGSSSNIVSLDLAGEFQTHLSSPLSPYNEYMSNTGTTPLFRWGKVKIPKANKGMKGRPISCSNLVVPSVYVGAKYDFQRAWYGATRLMSTFVWGDVAVGNNKSRVVPKLRGEYGLLRRHDYSMKLDLEFQRDGTASDGLEPMVSVRYDTNGIREDIATVAARAFIHPRVGVVAKGIVTGLGTLGIGTGTTKARYKNIDDTSALFQNRIPQDDVRWSEGSWLPDVKMTAGGKIITNSAIGLKKRLSGENSIGIRLMASRQLNWNIIGMLQGSNDAEEENNTMLRLEVGSLGDNSYTSISAEAAIENIPKTLRCTLLQERVFSI
eukprot:scaffold838_cov218-Chaetoceros_neogracile.AAC.15